MFAATWVQDSRKQPWRQPSSGPQIGRELAAAMQMPCVIHSDLVHAHLSTKSIRAVFTRQCHIFSTEVVAMT